MSTYNNVTKACVKCQNTVCGWERVSVAWIGMPRKVGNFTLPGVWSPCLWLWGLPYMRHLCERFCWCLHWVHGSFG